MNGVAALGAASTVVAVAFALCTFDSWVARRAPHELAWSQSLAMFAIASGAYWWGAAAGWTVGVFRVFYLFGAILNVPYLAAGTLYLLAPRRIAVRFHRWLHLTAMFCAGVMATTPAKPVPRVQLPVGKEIFGVLPRVMAAVGSGVGATILIVGAVMSAVRLVRARGMMSADSGAERARLGRLALTNALIASGSLILGVGGALFTGADAMAAFGSFLTLGISVLFIGFLISSPRTPSGPRSLLAPDGLSPFMAELWAVASETGRSTTGATAGGLAPQSAGATENA